MRRISQLLALIVIAGFIIPLFLPNRIEAEAESIVPLPVALVYEEFINLNEFSQWEPWGANDTLAEKEFYSPYRGEGAGYVLSSSAYSGEFDIVKTKKEAYVEFDLTGLGLGKQSHMTVELSAYSPDSTRVVWKVDSKKISYFSRYFSYFTSHKLEELLLSGLANLESKLISSPLSEDQLSILNEGMISAEGFEGRKVLAVENTATSDTEEIETAVNESLGYIRSYLKDFLKIPEEEVGRPVIYFESVDPAAKEIKFYCGYTLSGSAVPDEGMVLKSIAAGENLAGIFNGSYDEAMQMKEKIQSYAKENDFRLQKEYWIELPKNFVPGESTDALSILHIPIKD